MHLFTQQPTHSRDRRSARGVEGDYKGTVRWVRGGQGIEKHKEAAGRGGRGGGGVVTDECKIEGEPSPEALILSQGLPNLTATICIWEE